MLLSKHIQQLQKILTQKGDLEILIDGSDENGGGCFGEPELTVSGDTVFIQEQSVPDELNKTRPAS